MEAKSLESLKTKQPRIAVYPCCSLDFVEPLKIIEHSGLADEIIFCDIKPQSKKFTYLNKNRSTLSCRYLQGDFRTTVNQLPLFDVLFYRNDSDGEGGSSIFMLGDSFLPKVLARMNQEQSFIITDGSNSRGHNFERMQRPSGLNKHGRHFQLHSSQLDDYPDLRTIIIHPL